MYRAVFYKKRNCESMRWQNCFDYDIAQKYIPRCSSFHEIGQFQQKWTSKKERKFTNLKFFKDFEDRVSFLACVVYSDNDNISD
jgi:hypothetical protein